MEESGGWGGNFGWVITEGFSGEGAFEIKCEKKPVRERGQARMYIV